MVPKWQTILNALLMGSPVQHQDQDWALSAEMEMLVKYGDEDKWVRPLGELSLG